MGQATLVNSGALSADITAPPASSALRAFDDPALAPAFAHCRDITRRRARNFYYGLRLTPEPRRSALFAVYAWMRAADDAVDEPGDPATVLARLDSFADLTERVIGAAHSGDAPPDDAGPLGAALAASISAYGLAPEIFRDMLAALRDDASGSSPQTDDDLARYCYGVAGTAGLACLTIWGLRPDADATQARELALRRGQAFQRTNILRDFAQDLDAAHPRVYIPAEAFTRHGLTPADLRAWARPDACAALVHEQAAIAREHYAVSAALESMIDPACAPTLWAMTRIYSGLLEQIEDDPRRIIGPRIRLASATKASIALRAALGARMNRW